MPLLHYRSRSRLKMEWLRTTDCHWYNQRKIGKSIHTFSVNCENVSKQFFLMKTLASVFQYSAYSTCILYNKDTFESIHNN